MKRIKQLFSFVGITFIVVMFLSLLVGSASA
jgi:hypothetical protein